MDPSQPKLKTVSPVDGSISNLQEESQHSCSCTDRTDVSLTETGYELGLYDTGKIINDLAFGIWHKGLHKGFSLLDIPTEDC